MELQKEFLDLEEVASYIGVSVATVLRYIKSTENPLPVFRITQRHLVVNKQELDAWIFNFRDKKLEEKN